MVNVDRKSLIGGVVVLVVVFGVIAVFRGNGDTVEKASVPQGKSSAEKIYSDAVALKDEGKVVEAKTDLQKILTDHSDFKDVAKVQKELEDLNINLIFSNTEAPDKTVIHEVQPGDTLGGLAKKYGTTVDLIKRSNSLTSNVIKVGQKLRVWTGQFNIFVDKSQNLLTLKDGDEIVKVYEVSTGAGNITPVGKFKIVSKLVDPVWFHKGMVVPPESPQNVLGTRWLGFDLQGYGIHGTTEPDKIGQQVTAGCVRMRNEEVEELFSIVPQGTEVVIVD